MEEKSNRIIIHAPKISMGPSANEIYDFLESNSIEGIEGVPQPDTGDQSLDIIAYIVNYDSHE